MGKADQRQELVRLQVQELAGAKESLLRSTIIMAWDSRAVLGQVFLYERRREIDHWFEYFNVLAVSISEAHRCLTNWKHG